MTTKIRDFMSTEPKYCSTNDSVRDIAKLFQKDDIGAVVICNDEKRLQGVVTDRDLAVEVIATGKDPDKVTAGELVDGREVVTIGADDSIDEAIKTMKDHAVRRLPVIDGTELVGFISQADIALNANDKQAGDLVEAISAAPDNTGRG